MWQFSQCTAELSKVYFRTGYKFVRVLIIYNPTVLPQLLIRRSTRRTGGGGGGNLEDLHTCVLEFKGWSPTWIVAKIVLKGSSSCFVDRFHTSHEHSAF